MPIRVEEKEKFRQQLFTGSFQQTKVRYLLNRESRHGTYSYFGKEKR